MDDHTDEMFCPSCGERMSRSANFCRHCGEPNRKKTRWGPAHRGPPGGGGDDRCRDDRGHPPADPPSESRRVWDEPPDGRYRDTQHRPDGRRPHDHRPPDGNHRDIQHRPDGRHPHDHPQPAAPYPDLHRDPEGIQWRDYLPPAARRPGESPVRVVAVAIGLGVLGMVLLGIVSIVGALPAIAVGLSVPAAVLLGTVVGQYVGFAGLSVWYLRWRGLDWDALKGYLGIRKPTLRQIGLIFGAWIVILIGMLVVSVAGQAVLELLGASDAGDVEQETTQLFADNPELVPPAILMMFLVVGPCEEILFRGVIQGRLRERLSPAVAIAIASAFFALIHAPGFIGSIEGIVLGVSVLTVGGVVFGAVYEYTQNLVVVSILHGFHNSMIILFIYIAEVYDLEESMVLAELLGPGLL